ncbi:MAG: helix-turn-helix domain-containing protein [Gammaproteobacteria bacterium]|nr:helix-turn-helix domain-containing protein [Gammaproteobacteria bacterium]MCB1923299.1 helix-turn-helix domain-containing protein [Gammaproteobacteria bacterium]
MQATEIAELRNAVRHHVSGSREQRFCYRALCVLLIAEGHRPNQVAEWLGEHTRTLERWRKRFVDNGLHGLMDETSPGRPPKLSTEEWQRLKQDLEQAPTHYGLDGKKWQGKLLQRHLANSYGIDFSLRQCQRLLKQVKQRPVSLGYKSDASRSYTPTTDRIGTD